MARASGLAVLHRAGGHHDRMRKNSAGRCPGAVFCGFCLFSPPSGCTGGSGGGGPWPWSRRHLRREDAGHGDVLRPVAVGPGGRQQTELGCVLLRQSVAVFVAGVHVPHLQPVQIAGDGGGALFPVGVAWTISAPWPRAMGEKAAMPMRKIASGSASSPSA